MSAAIPEQELHERVVVALSASAPDQEKGVRLDEKHDATEVDFEVPSSRQSPWQRPFSPRDSLAMHRIRKACAVMVKFGRFMGPGAIISVAYIDPDNFQTAVTSGAELEYKLLFMVLISNVVAIYLQSLAVKLGSVTGMDLAQMNRAHLPRWLNIGLYILAELAIVATDIGQVIGTAIAINILIPKIPLVAGATISVADTLFILLFYRPDGSMKGLRWFEIFVSTFVIGVFVCFCIELSLIKNTTAKHVLDGFLPSRDIFVSQGLYQSCAILGGTLMPHTIYLGSSLVKPRLRDFDIKNDCYREAPTNNTSSALKLYRPSLSAIRSCMDYSIAELCVTLFIVAVFVNSAILIISASSLSEAAQDADLFGMYHLFVTSISQAAGTMFALALLFSGISAGIVATMAGQLVCEGALNWRMRPFFRRLLTRCIAVVPGLIIAAAGRKALAEALNACNVVLSVALIFLTFPLIWYTTFRKYMEVEAEAGVSALTVESVDVHVEGGNQQESTEEEGQHGGALKVNMANHWAVSAGGWFIWVMIAVMNVATLTLLGLGTISDK